MNEFDLAFEHWQDPDFLIDFFNENQSLINTDYWKENLPSLNPAELSKAISKEALELENFLKNLARNTSKKRLPDFDTHFKELGGKKYKFLQEHIPHKSYGTNHPTMIRLYAIKIESNCYIVVHGGLKLTHDIQETPSLNKELFPKLDFVIQYLKANGVIESEDILE